SSRDSICQTRNRKNARRGEDRHATCRRHCRQQKRERTKTQARKLLQRTHGRPWRATNALRTGSRIRNEPAGYDHAQQTQGRPPMNKHLAESELATPKVTTGPVTGSRKVYATPEAAPDLKVPLREVVLDASSGEPPVPVYDPSGPYTDPDATIDVERGLPRPREAWVRERGGVEDYRGRPIKPAATGNVRGTARRIACAVSGRGIGRHPSGNHALSDPGRGTGSAPLARASPHHPARMGARRRHHKGNDLYRR